MVLSSACEERLQQARTWWLLNGLRGKLLHCVLDMLDLVLSLSLLALNVAEFGLRLASLELICACVSLMLAAFGNTSWH